MNFYPKFYRCQLMAAPRLGKTHGQQASADPKVPLQVHREGSNDRLSFSQPSRASKSLISLSNRHHYVLHPNCIKSYKPHTANGLILQGPAAHFLWKWSIYALVLEKRNAHLKVYIGSGTSTHNGVSANIGDYDPGRLIGRLLWTSARFAEWAALQVAADFIL